MLFHALTVIREHRGDGHIAALLTAELSGIEALVSHTATGRGFTERAAKATRGWSDEQWAEAEASLADRGYLNEDGSLNEAGTQLRRDVEAATNVLGLAPWDALGAAGTARLAELGRPLVARALGAGAFPDGVFA